MGHVAAGMSKGTVSAGEGVRFALKLPAWLTSTDSSGRDCTLPGSFSAEVDLFLPLR